MHFLSCWKPYLHMCLHHYLSVPSFNVAIRNENITYRSKDKKKHTVLRVTFIQNSVLQLVMYVNVIQPVKGSSIHCWMYK